METSIQEPTQSSSELTEDTLKEAAAKADASVEIEATDTSQETEASPTLEGDATEPAEPAYEPNFKYTVRDEEREFDPRLREWIKSKEDEEFVRELVTKADGIEFIKGQRDDYRSRYQSLEEEAKQVVVAAQTGKIGDALKALGADTSDISKTLSGLGYTKDQIIKYAYELAQLTPEQEQLQNRAREAESSRMQYERRLQEQEQRLLQFQVQTRQSELQSVLSMPEVAPIVTAYDQAHGKDAFKEKVIAIGQMHAASGKDLSAKEAVDELLKLARTFQPQQQQVAQQVPAAPQATQPKPTLPTLGSASSQSPSGRAIKSIDDIEKIYSEKYGS